MARNEHKKVLEQLSEAYQEVINEGGREYYDNSMPLDLSGGHDDDSDAALWRKQLKHQSKVSPEELERIKNLPPIEKTGRLTQPKIENDEYDLERKDNIDYAKSKRYEPDKDDVISQLDVEAAARERLRQKYGEDNEEPKRGISGYEHKPDALVSARQAGAKHKPYVSSFVGDGGKKIFAILGSDGKIVHKTHNKQEAHQWLQDNYDNI